MKILLRKVLNRFNRIKNIVFNKLGKKYQYKIGNFWIQLDYTHALPNYQSAHPFYDRFLPHFVSYLPFGKVVIDVGANVGDTLFGMVSNNPNLEYVCIEADKGFFEDLKVNYQNLSKEIPKSKIHLINKFIGDTLTDVSLDGENGTKKAIIGGGDIKSESLDDILDRLLNVEDIALIKTDVDGFDYDVLRSAHNSIKHKPYLFFECLNEGESQHFEYKKSIAELFSLGYDKFTIFDNFGQYIFTSSSVDEVTSLLDYIYLQNTGKGTRTFHYIDILAYSVERETEVRKILNDYRMSI